MALKELVGVRQFTTFTSAGKIQKMYQVTFTTDKTDGTFTFDVPRDDYSAAKAIAMAKARAEDIDKAIGYGADHV